PRLLGPGRESPYLCRGSTKQMKRPLIIFVRAPRQGQVKTRLATSIGAGAALAAYTTLVRNLLDNLSPLSNVELRFTPDDSVGEFTSWLRPGWDLKPQGDGDLGSRLLRAFRQAFEDGLERV